jgi:hypothetical protein
MIGPARGFQDRHSQDGGRRLKHRNAWIVVLIGVLGFLVVANASAQTKSNPPPVDESKLPDNQKSETEVNKELSNPISSIWALQIQENTYFIHPGIEDKSSRNSVNVQFQPVLPLA